jgi:hypothetical protein
MVWNMLKLVHTYNINDAFTQREHIMSNQSAVHPSQPSVWTMCRCYATPLQNATQENMLVPAPPPTHFVSLPTPSRSFLSLSSPLANLANYWYPYYCTLTLPNLFAPLSRHHLRSPIQEPYVVYMALMT